jgi:hypothetical protein
MMAPRMPLSVFLLNPKTAPALQLDISANTLSRR